MMTPYTTHVLAGASLALAVALVALGVTPQGTLRNTHWVEPAAIKPDLANPDAQVEPRESASVSSFLGMLERPLFSPSRRPPPPPPPPKPVQQPEEDPFTNIQLQGLYAGPSGSGGILVRVDGKTRSIPVGAMLGPWTIKSIDGREVLFTRGDESRRLRLIPAKLANAAPPPPRAAAPGAPAGAAPSQTDDPVRRQQQEQEEQLRARLQLMNARRAANGLPPLTELK